MLSEFDTARLGLVDTALDVQVSSSISTDDAAETGKSVCVRSSSLSIWIGRVLAVFSVAADVEANLLCKGVTALRP